MVWSSSLYYADNLTTRHCATDNLTVIFPFSRASRAIAFIGALLTGVALAGHAPASALPAYSSEFSELQGELRGARGPEVYVALRRMWQAWDFGEADAVERALREVRDSRTFSAPVRAYAGLLSAYAQRRRGNFDAAKQAIAKLGFVSDWLVVGPFDNEGKSGLMRPFAPEHEQLEPIDLSRNYEGKERPVHWRNVPQVSPYGWFPIGSFLRPSESICAYATAFVHDVRKSAPARRISLWSGSAGAMRVWWNGVEVIRDEKYRNLDADRFAAGVTLERGFNQIFVKICGDEQSPTFSLRIAAADGAPDSQIRVDTAPRDSRLLPPRPAPGRASFKQSGPPFGAVQWFERQLKENASATREPYARYLQLTQGDDPAVHLARELANKAVAERPTIGRLLLAGELAENRNQRVDFIERAEALVKPSTSKSDSLATLLARAIHVRGGPTWRDSIPYFDRVLQRDRDNIAATLARIELYSEAGMRATAVSFGQAALARKPRTAALIRAMNDLLQEMNRTAEARALADRYAAIRFDDASLMRAHADLAIAQHKPSEAKRWLALLVAANPDNTSVLNAAARAYATLGDRPHAIATLREALAIAPEDTDLMRALADEYGFAGDSDDQVKLLRRIVELKPQLTDVRDYIAHTEPAKELADEKYARSSAEFLKLRNEPAAGRLRRNFVQLHVTTVFPNGLASRFHQVVFQPLSEAAAIDARQYSFGYEVDAQSVQLRVARVYRANGEIDEAVETGESDTNDPSVNMYTSYRAYVVRFPRLQAGDVVELQYRIEDVSPRNAYADYFGEVVPLQSSEPIAFAEYVLLTPKERAFYFNHPRLPGLKKSVEEESERRIYRFEAQNVPPIEQEPMQPAYSELVAQVVVSTYKSWDDMDRWYWGLIRDQFVPDDALRERVRALTHGLVTEDQKVRAIYDYVVQKTRYVALEFGIFGIKPYRTVQTFARGFGDCKDKASLLVTMLKAAGIDATMVLLRTGMRGRIDPDPASLSVFDHAIAYVPSLNLYLDGTAEFTGSRELPSMDRGAFAMQVNQGVPKLVTLPEPPASDSVQRKEMKVALDADGAAVINLQIDVTGASAPSYRSRYHAVATREQRFQEDIASSTGFAGASVTNVTASDLDDVEKPVMIGAHVEVPAYARRDGDSLTAPIGPGEFLSRQYASLKARKEDVRIQALTTIENDTTVQYPSGMHAVTLPTSREETSRFGTVRVQVESTPTSIHSKTTVAMTAPRISPADYPEFRAWCERADRALGQRLGLAVDSN